MSTILYEWEFVNYICRVVESEPGIVHFEQARKGSGGDPRVMEFQRTTTPIGAANEIIQLHQALGEAKMLNLDPAAFFRGCQEDRNRREREFEELKAAYESSHASRVHADEAVLRLEADLEAARGALRIARKGWFLQLPPHDWAELPAVRKAWEGR